MLLALIIAFLIAAPASDLFARVERTAEADFRRTYGMDEDDVQLEVVRVTGDLSSDASIRFEWPDTPPEASVQVRIVSDRDERGWALMRIRHFAMVARPMRDVTPGDIIDASVLEYVRVDITSFRGEPLTAERLAQLKSDRPLVARRRLRAGRAVRIDDLSVQPVISRGEQVLMEYERGGIALSITCTSREDGGEGDAVRLYSGDTKSTYRARITGAGTAQWIETL